MSDAAVWGIARHFGTLQEREHGEAPFCGIPTHLVSPYASVLSRLCRTYAGRSRREIVVVIVHPIEGALDRLAPLAVAAVADRRVHPRDPLRGLVPVRAQRLVIAPEADAQARRVGRAQRDSL